MNLNRRKFLILSGMTVGGSLAISACQKLYEANVTQNSATSAPNPQVVDAAMLAYLAIV